MSKHGQSKMMMSKGFYMPRVNTLLFERSNFMKKTVAVLVLVIVGLLAGLVSASSETVYASFYNGNPDKGASRLTKVSVLTGPVSKQITGIENATYVVIEYAGESYSYKIDTIGDRRNYIILKTKGKALHSGKTNTLTKVVSDIMK